MNERTKSRFEVVATSYGRNKNRDDKIKKNHEKSNNSPKYRCAAIKNILQKIVKYYFSDCIYEQKLMNFYGNEIKVSHVAQKDNF